MAGTGTAQTTTGCGVASDMTNVVVDDTHHVTSFHLADGNANIDAINYDTNIEPGTGRPVSTSIVKISKSI